MQKELSVSGKDGDMNATHLLTPDEGAACEALASGEAPHSQRAQALLALDRGATQAEAAQVAGLSLGQLRYWLGKFRESRMAIFPESTPEPMQVAADTLSMSGEEPSNEIKAPSQSGKKAAKKKKSGKGKETQTKKVTKMAKGKKKKKNKSKDNKPAKKSKKKKKK